MPFKKISQKVQARLPFTPLSPSPPAPDGFSQLREQRRMTVLIHSPSPAKKRRVAGPPQPSHSSGLEYESYAQNPRRGRSFLPTPASSSQTGPGIPTLMPHINVEILVTSSEQSDKGYSSSDSKSRPRGQRNGSASLASDSGDDSDIVPIMPIRATRNTRVSVPLGEHSLTPSRLILLDIISLHYY